MNTKVINTETIASAIRKYINIKHESIVETKVSAIASNTIEGDIVIARHGSDLTIDQTNKLKQQVEVVYIYKALDDISEDELFVIESIRSRFADADGFWDEEYIRKLLGPEYDDATLELDLDDNVIRATFETGEISIVPIDELEVKLVADYEHNENTFTQAFISNYQHSIDRLRTSAKSVQSNRMHLQDVTLVESQVAWKQTNESIQSVVNKLDKIADGLQEKLDESIDESISEKPEEKSNLFVILLIVSLAVLVSGLLFVILVLPGWRAGMPKPKPESS